MSQMVTIVLNENDELEVSTAVLNDIALKVNTSDIVNDLTSTDTNKPLVLIKVKY